MAAEPHLRVVGREAPALDEFLEDAAARITRFSPREAFAAVEAGALIVLKAPV